MRYFRCGDFDFKRTIMRAHKPREREREEIVSYKRYADAYYKLHNFQRLVKFFIEL